MSRNSRYRGSGHSEQPSGPRKDVVVPKEKARGSSGVVSTQSMSWQHFLCCSSEDLRRDSHGYVGLRNKGATCYLNTVLQTLFMTEKFREAVESFSNAKKGSVSHELQKLFKDLKKSETTVSTMGVITALNTENVHEQRDAAEYLEKILESVDPELSEMFKGEKTTSQGKKSGKQSVPFYSLPITLTPDPQDVKRCFNSLFDVKMMNGGKQQCGLHKERELEKRCELSKLPEVLVLQLNRFQVDKSTTRTINNFTIPHLLRTKLYTYDLYAVINHAGSLSGGHYCASIKSSFTGVTPKAEMDFNIDKACILLYKRGHSEQTSGPRKDVVVPKDKASGSTQDFLCCSSEDLRRDSHGYVGLRNQGATCYLNTVLQTLFMTEKFREAVESFSNAKKGSVSHELQKLFKDLKKSETTVSTMGVITALNIENVHEQCDAAEYLEKILESVDPELSEMFMGEKTTLTICQGKCTKFQKQILNFYSLPITLTSDPNDVVCVQSCFNAHFSAELMNGENQLYCQHCERDTDREMICELSTFPEVLVLQLKRFQLDYTLWTFVKNNCPVSVPYQLHTELYTYDLYAVVNHIGSLSGGHYYASIKSFDDGHWYEFNDSRVYPTTNSARRMYTTSESTRVPSKPEMDFISYKACILLYKRNTEQLTEDRTLSVLPNKENHATKPGSVQHKGGSMPNAHGKTADNGKIEISKDDERFRKMDVAPAAQVHEPRDPRKASSQRAGKPTSSLAEMPIDVYTKDTSAPAMSAQPLPTDGNAVSSGGSSCVI